MSKGMRRETDATRVGRMIRRDWGTVKHFCKVKDISFHSYMKVLQGKGMSRDVVDVLERCGYIKYVERAAHLTVLDDSDSDTKIENKKER